MNTPTPPATTHHGRNLRRIRELLGIKQDYLAVTLNVSQQAISLMEQKETLDKDVLQKVSKALGVTEGAIENFNDEVAINIISSTLHHTNGIVNYFPSFNIADKWLEAVEENKKLYGNCLGRRFLDNVQ
jgi:transcriptional regulator with XRE-family HTH domain